MIIGEEYSFKFAGSILKGKLIEIKETYGNLILYVFKCNDGYTYPINLNQIII